MSVEDQAGVERRRSPLLISTLILGLLVLLVVLVARFYTDYLWFSSVSASTVFTTQLAARAGCSAPLRWPIGYAPRCGVRIWIPSCCSSCVTTWTGAPGFSCCCLRPWLAC